MISREFLQRRWVERKKPYSHETIDRAIGFVANGGGDWQKRANCSPDDAKLFFSESGTRNEPKEVKEAKAICRKCPVVEQCLKYALNNGEIGYGVWGGLTPKERRMLRRRR